MLLLVAPYAYGANLSIASQSLSIGEVASTAVVFAGGGQSVSGIQFDVQWDPALTVQLVAGPAIGQSSKILYTASLGSNTMRCLIVGMNQTVLADGPLVQLFVTVGFGSVPGVVNVTLANTVATDPNGTAVPVQPVAAQVMISDGAISQTLLPQGILNALTSLPSTAAPGEIMTLLGAFSANSPSVLFNGSPATIIYAGNTQINAVVPFGLDVSRAADLQVKSQNQKVAEVSVAAAPAAPSIFTLYGSGSGPAIVYNQDCTPNSWSNPALPGSMLTVYGTGFGQTTPAAVDGQIQREPASTVLAVTATIGGVPAQVTYAGASPGSLAGIYMINVLVPAIAPSPDAPLVITAGTSPTQAGVTVAVQ